MVFYSADGYLEEMIEVQSSCVCVGEGGKDELAVSLTSFVTVRLQSDLGCS